MHRVSAGSVSRRGALPPAAARRRRGLRRQVRAGLAALRAARPVAYLPGHLLMRISGPTSWDEEWWGCEAVIIRPVASECYRIVERKKSMSRSLIRLVYGYRASGFFGRLSHTGHVVAFAQRETRSVVSHIGRLCSHSLSLSQLLIFVLKREGPAVFFRLRTDTQNMVNFRCLLREFCYTAVSSVGFYLGSLHRALSHEILDLYRFFIDTVRANSHRRSPSIADQNAGVAPVLSCRP